MYEEKQPSKVEWDLAATTEAMAPETIKSLPRIDMGRFGKRVRLEDLAPVWAELNDPLEWLKEQRKELKRSTEAVLVAATMLAWQSDQMCVVYRCQSCKGKERKMLPEKVRSFHDKHGLIVNGPWVPMEIHGICPFCQHELLFQYGMWRSDRFDEPRPIHALAAMELEEGEEKTARQALDMALMFADDLDESGGLGEKVALVFQDHVAKEKEEEPKAAAMVEVVL